MAESESKDPITTLPVLVTGASGFFASELIKQLLKLGYRVRGTVRKNPDDERYAWIRNLAGPELAGNVELVAGDLLTEAAFDEAVNGCEYIFHTASPYSFKADDPQRDLVDPALQGTLNVLRSCAKANVDSDIKIKRVILTSSVGAVNVAPEGDKIYSEEDWNETSSLDNNPYAYSKRLAEQAAWKYVKELSDAEKFEMVVINPSTIIGAANHPSHISNPSLDMIARVLSEFPGVMKFSYYLVDVVDVAGSHILGMTKPEAAGNRYICHCTTVWMKDLIALVKSREGFEHYKTPSIPMSGHCSTWFTKNVGSYFYPKQEGVYIRNQLGHFQAYDTTKIKEHLGYTFRDLKLTMFDTVDSLIEAGRIKPPK